MKNKFFVFIIPSYNETKNLKILIERIKKSLPGSKIVVVDDSPLNENEKLKSALKSYKNITIISRFKKSGRGSAVILGFKEALKDKNIKYLFEIDSDLAHNPEEVER
ncbi:MAG: glycosyltransferase, partial [Patescibacteria group bacterium]|nr:glycosyltransferase [Patescibacteria group bacterium]